MILNQYASVTELRGKALWVTFKDSGARDNFNRSAGEEYLEQAIMNELGVRVQVRARIESEPIPADGTAILSLAKPPLAETPAPPDQPVLDSAGPSDTSERTDVPPENDEPRVVPEPDPPSEQDDIIDNPANQAEELVIELFDAELVKEEPTKPSPRRKN